jgi:hypothetical protein
VQDSPTYRQSILEATLKDNEVWLAGIRERRLKPIRIFAEAEEARLKAKHDRINEKLAKKLASMQKKMEAVDKGIAAIEQGMLEVQALVIQLEAEGGTVNACVGT